MSLQIIPFDENKPKRHKAAPISDADWARCKDLVVQMHRGGAMLKDIRPELLAKHGVDATQRQLWLKMNEWRLTRYNRGDLQASEANVSSTETGLNTVRVDVVPLPSPLSWFKLDKPSHEQIHMERSNFDYSVHPEEPASEPLLACVFWKYSPRRSLRVRDVLLKIKETCTKPSGVLRGKVLTSRSKQQASVEAWILRYGLLMGLLRQWISTTETFDIMSLSWMYLFVYELAYTTALVARYDPDRGIIQHEESLKHYHAAGDFLSMLSSMSEVHLNDLQWFIGVYRDFDQRIRAAEGGGPGKETVDTIWSEGLILVPIGRSGKRMTTRSRSYVIVEEDSEHPFIDF